MPLAARSWRFWEALARALMGTFALSISVCLRREVDGARAQNCRRAAECEPARYSARPASVQLSYYESLEDGSLDYVSVSRDLHQTQAVVLAFETH